jgi:hypothetical protein
VTIPAELERAYLVDTQNHTALITPTDAFYRLQLEGARCDEECLIGGPPLIVVEDEHLPFTTSLGRGVNLDYFNGLADLDSQVDQVLDTITPSPPKTPTSQPASSVALTSGENGIITDNKLDIQPVTESAPQTPTEAQSESAADTELASNESTSKVGLWVIGLGLIVAAGLGLVVRRGHRVE